MSDSINHNNNFIGKWEIEEERDEYLGFIAVFDFTENGDIYGYKYTEEKK